MSAHPTTLTTPNHTKVQVRLSASMRTRHGVVRMQGEARKQRERSSRVGKGVLGPVLDRHIRVATGDFPSSTVVFVCSFLPVDDDGIVRNQ